MAKREKGSNGKRGQNYLSLAPFTGPASNNAIAYTYNALGQLESENWFADTGTSTASHNAIGYTYKDAGELLTATDTFGSSDARNSKYTFTTNELGWVTQVDNNGGS